ncbi:MAG: phosphate ABC transporter substrate-binding protein [Microcoleaceae cyanobacterium]
MSQRQGPPPILFILLLIGLLGAGYWFFIKSKATNVATNNTSPPVENTANNQNTPITNSDYPPPVKIASGTTVRIGGSTSMAKINQNLKVDFQKQFPGTVVYNTASGSTQGIKDVLAGSADLAGVSRPLSSAEISQGLTATPITQDQIAIVVGKNNPFDQSLTSEQVKNIFQGKIKNWSEVGGADAEIQVINRPPISGTHETFKEIVLLGESFGNTPNIKTLEQDATTPLLQALGNDGIGYATYSQVANQQTVRSLLIDDASPEQPNYPYQRQLYYVYKNPLQQNIKDFLGYVFSPAGQASLGKE